MAKNYFVFDIETRSECDLKKCGAAEYARHPTTGAFCVSWANGPKNELFKAPIESWSPVLGGRKEFLIEKLLDPDTILVAHNASFERAITRFVLSRILKEPRLQNLEADRFLCTASMACSLGLPRSLEGACSSLDLGEKKDGEGRKLILKYTKPRKATAGNSAKWHNDLNDLKRIIQYCENDVKAEVELLLSIPELSDFERRLWILDQKINERGFQVDRGLVLACLKLIEQEKALIEARTVELSKGEIPSTTQRDKTLEWLKSKGVNLPNLQAKTVRDFLATGEGIDEAREILSLRQSASKTSTAKYEAFEARSRFDGRSRDNLIFHSASTGRWAGSGVQMQNLPRSKTKDTDQLAEVLRLKDLELARLLYGDPMSAISDALRSCFVASPGKELFVVDYSSIEVRVLFWLAGHEEGLKSFREGRDLYVEMAARIFKKAAKDISKEERALGKAVILGCGYSMSAGKFYETCKLFGMKVSEDLAKLAVDTYREVHSPVVELWKKFSSTTIAAVQNKKTYNCGKVKWGMDGDFLFMELPSARRLSYYRPSLRNEATPWGEMRPCLYPWAQNGLTRKWEQYKFYGALGVENACQAISRDLIADAMLKAEGAGFEVLLSVHDELIAERKIGERELKDFEKIMLETPVWASGLPIAVEGFKSRRYRK